MDPRSENRAPHDRTVLVVGAAGGVGEGVTRALLGHGWHVIAASRGIDKLRKLEERLGGTGPGRLDIRVTDIATPDSARLTRELLAEHGPLDGAVVTAASWGTAGRRSILQTSNETWDSLMAANLTTQFRAYRALVPAVRREGALVNLAGYSAEIPFPGSAAIAAANAATKSLGLTLAAELGARGPRIYQLILGVIRTRPRQEAGIDDPSWYRAEDIGHHVADLLAGNGPHADQVLQYLLDPATGVRTAPPARL